MKHGGATHDCVNADAAQCKYTQNNDAEEWPKLKSLAKTGNTMTFTGEKFFTSGYTVEAYYSKIKASMVVINSETEILAIFDGGVPIFTKLD